MRILVFSHYFYPEGNAPANRMLSQTRRWVAAGHQVTVMTGVPNVPRGVPYDGYRNRWRQHETIEGVNVIRVWTYLAANRGKGRRILNYLSFMCTAAWHGRRIRDADISVATSPQFFCAWAGMIYKWYRKKPLIIEIRDLWPDSIKAVGAMKSGMMMRCMEWLESRLYAGADHIVTVGQGYAEALVSKGLARERITVIPNGMKVVSVAEKTVESTPFTCAYIGTVGMACGLEVVLRAAEHLYQQNRRDIRFRIVGDGAMLDELKQQADPAWPLEFSGRIAQDEIDAVYNSADVCLVHLRKEKLFETVLPSKLIEAAAHGRPVICGVDGYARRWVDEAACGLFMEPGNEKALLACLEQMKQDKSTCNRMASNGRDYVGKHHDPDRLAEEYLNVLEHCT